MVEGKWRKNRLLNIILKRTCMTIFSQMFAKHVVARPIFNYDFFATPGSQYHLGMSKLNSRWQTNYHVLLTCFTCILILTVTNIKSCQMQQSSDVYIETADIATCSF